MSRSKACREQTTLIHFYRRLLGWNAYQLSQFVEQQYGERMSTCTIEHRYAVRKALRRMVLNAGIEVPNLPFNTAASDLRCTIDALYLDLCQKTGTTPHSSYLDMLSLTVTSNYIGALDIHGLNLVKKELCHRLLHS